MNLEVAGDAGEKSGKKQRLESQTLVKETFYWMHEWIPGYGNIISFRIVGEEDSLADGKFHLLIDFRRVGGVMTVL